MDNKELEKIAAIKSIESMGKWYGWESPIGLSIFFLTLTLIVILIKWAFFSHVGL